MYKTTENGGHSATNRSLPNLGGLELPELKEEEMPMV